MPVTCLASCSRAYGSDTSVHAYGSDTSVHACMHVCRCRCADAPHRRCCEDDASSTHAMMSSCCDPFPSLYPVIFGSVKAPLHPKRGSTAHSSLLALLMVLPSEIMLYYSSRSNLLTSTGVSRLPAPASEFTRAKSRCCCRALARTRKAERLGTVMDHPTARAMVRLSGPMRGGLARRAGFVHQGGIRLLEADALI
jgi:hypothetical protein